MQSNRIVHSGAGSAAAPRAQQPCSTEQWRDCASPHKPTAVLPMQILIIKIIVLILDTPLRMPSNPSLAVCERCNPAQLRSLSPHSPSQRCPCGCWVTARTGPPAHRHPESSRKSHQEAKGREGLGILIPNSCPAQPTLLPTHSPAPPDSPTLTGAGHTSAWGKSSSVCREPKLVPAPLPTVCWDL